MFSISLLSLILCMLTMANSSHVQTFSEERINGVRRVRGLLASAAADSEEVSSNERGSGRRVPRPRRTSDADRKEEAFRSDVHRIEADFDHQADKIRGYKVIGSHAAREKKRNQRKHKKVDRFADQGDKYRRKSEEVEVEEKELDEMARMEEEFLRQAQELEESHSESEVGVSDADIDIESELAALKLYLEAEISSMRVEMDAQFAKLEEPAREDSEKDE